MPSVLILAITKMTLDKYFSARSRQGHQRSVMVLSSLLERWGMSNPQQFHQQSSPACVSMHGNPVFYFSHSRCTGLPGLLFPRHILGCSIILSISNDQVNVTIMEERTQKYIVIFYICHLGSSGTGKATLSVRSVQDLKEK